MFYWIKLDIIKFVFFNKKFSIHIGERMIRNTDLIWNGDTLRLKLGGALLFYGVHLYVNSTFFQGNMGLVGGAISIDVLSYAVQDFLIENSDFEENISGNGGAIGLEVNVLNITGIIQKNYFLRNLAARSFKTIFYFKLL